MNHYVLAASLSISGARHGQAAAGRFMDTDCTAAARATAAPVHVAEPGVRAEPGSIHFVPPGLGIRTVGSGWAFDGVESLDPAQLPADDSAVLFLSGADTAEITLNCTITAASTKPLLLLFGLEFYQMVNDAQYSLKNGAFNCLSVIEISGE